MIAGCNTGKDPEAGITENIGEGRQARLVDSGSDEPGREGVFPEAAHEEFAEFHSAQAHRPSDEFLHQSLSQADHSDKNEEPQEKKPCPSLT